MNTTSTRNPTYEKQPYVREMLTAIEGETLDAYKYNHGEDEFFYTDLKLATLKAGERGETPTPCRLFKHNSGQYYFLDSMGSKYGYGYEVWVCNHTAEKHLELQTN